MSHKVVKKPGFFLSLIPLITLVSLLVLNVSIFKDDATYGANQLALLISAVVCGVIGIFHLKYKYKELEDKLIESIQLSMQANLILLVVGSLIGLWIISGVVPTMIYYGIQLINPSVFLPVACLVCVIVSTATGSSWSTGGTVGIALMGIGHTLQIPMEMVAGAVISGSYFGDKMSPLSDTTNLAPAIAGSELFEHIKHMVYSTIPAILLALIGFTVLGLFNAPTEQSIQGIDEVLRLMRENFYINPILFAVPGVVVLLVAKKVPALPALIIGCLVGALAALFFQVPLLEKMAGGTFHAKGAYQTLIETAFGGFKIESGNAMIDKLFNRGGMSGMLNTVWLIVVAMVFGGLMEATGMLQALTQAILKLVRGTTSLITSTVASCIFLNATASDQYLSIVVSGRMFRKAFQDHKLKAKNLSRTIEDGGTVTSVLVPWNSGGAYFSSILGVATTAYLPFCFFNLLCPLMAIVLAATNTGIEYEDDK